jgi:5-methylcytosine-specific restriction endonuclease McrA
LSTVEADIKTLKKMKRESIHNHLRPYSILGRRKTTINHAFASAIAPYEEYDDKKIIQALRDLGQDPDQDLICAYCGRNKAETWDHVIGLVKNQKFYGYGHTIGNLLPCCQSCNSRKGNKGWEIFLKQLFKEEGESEQRISELQDYFSRYLESRFGQDEIEKLCPEEMKELQKIRLNILALLEEADRIAERIRMNVKGYQSKSGEDK